MNNTLGLQPWDCISLLQYFPIEHKENSTLDDRIKLASTYTATGILPDGQYPLYPSSMGQETYRER